MTQKFLIIFWGIFQILAQGQDSVDGITILPDIFCNPKNLSNYIDISHNGAVHLNTTLEKISEKLCSITKSPDSLFDMSEMIFQELNLELLVHMVCVSPFNFANFRAVAV